MKKNHLDPLIEPSKLSRNGGFAAMKTLWSCSPELTAVFSCNDDTAFGVIAAAQELGLKVPGDLSVIGFDNIDLASEYKPALTTIHVHKSWMGTIGVRLLIERARNPDKPVVTTVISTQLVIRDSVQSIP
jgi:LacI family transcriptional regulator